MAQGAQRPSRLLPHRQGSKISSNYDERNLAGTHEKTTDAATIAYIKSILCAKPTQTGTSADDNVRDVPLEPLEELLPPLTSSNAIDVQLYAIIAVVLNLFVQTWYHRITPDQSFVDEIVHIIAHCTRGLEQRVRKVDLESLLLDELPCLLSEHIQAVRSSRASDLHEPANTKARVKYHALRPHMALEPVPVDLVTAENQAENETTWCILLVNRVLPLLLPPEDMTNPCLDVMVSEVLSELIFRNGICGKACEAWLLWDGITKLLRSAAASSGDSGPISATACLDHENGSSAGSGSLPTITGQRRTSFIGSFWSFVSILTLVWVVLRSFLAALMQATSIPARTSRSSTRSTGVSVKSTPSKSPDLFSSNSDKRPMISMQIWGCVHEVLSLDLRMPWLSGVLSLMQWALLVGPGQLCCTNSRLDRLMSFHVQRTLLHSRWVPSVLQAARNALFPGNVLGPARIPPTMDETAAIKFECAVAIVEALPEALRVRFFATKDKNLMVEDVAAELDVLADPYVNKGLVIRAIELIAVRLFPELTASSDSSTDQ